MKETYAGVDFEIRHEEETTTSGLVISGGQSKPKYFVNDEEVNEVVFGLLREKIVKWEVNARFERITKEIQ